MEDQFKIKVKDFEGPLELLLNLIEKRKLHISEVSLAQVADDYVQHIRQFEQMPMGDMANFVLVASTLMLIKSVALLPQLELNPEEKQSIEDLENRLKLYQRIRELSGHIKEKYGQNIIFGTEATKQMVPVFAPTGEITLGGLKQSIINVLNNLPKVEKLPQVVVKKIVSLEEVIESLTKRIQSSMKMRFSEFVKEHKEEKVSIIVSFLGMLELVKQGIVAVEQASHFEDIAIESTAPDVPRY